MTRLLLLSVLASCTSKVERWCDAAQLSCTGR